MRRSKVTVVMKQHQQNEVDLTMEILDFLKESPNDSFSPLEIAKAVIKDNPSPVASDVNAFLYNLLNMGLVENNPEKPNGAKPRWRYRK